MNNNKLDSMGIGKALQLFPDQIKRTFKESLESNLEKLDFDSVVITGMGGSSNAGKMIASWQEDTNNIPIVVYNDYGLPSWVNSKTLVVLNSYSGNTEETISAYDPAKQKDCMVVGLTTGGKIGELISSGEIKGAIISAEDTNPSTYPKSGLGLSLGGLIGVLVKVGLLNFSEEKLNSALDELVEIRASWNVEEMSGKLAGFTPVYFGSRQFVGALNAGRNATCEIGRVFTQFYDFPEVNHVLVEALQIPEEVKRNRYLFFESKFDNERIKLRYKITKEIFNEMGLTYFDYQLKGVDKFVQSMEIAHYAAWLGYNMSILRSDDPGPEPWILKLKKSLSQPVH
ncbi:SIS domain-containing protein [Candidatus Microgenomates bacterium]|nr:SIS domain-containing protein [Candidatus Microgenomates bacterium]